MAKSSNPLDEFKRKQRKKEKLKNKTKRISARDAKVAETVSLSTVQSDIKKLETQKEEQNGHLDNKDTRKLERLRKELKIVQGAEEERKQKAEEKVKQEWEDQKKHMKSSKGVEELNQAKFQNSKASIYYDAVMNPFGAPPPGKPMFYHRRGGGRTMDPSEAFVPYELRDENDDKSVDLDLGIESGIGSGRQKVDSGEVGDGDGHGDGDGGKYKYHSGNDQSYDMNMNMNGQGRNNEGQGQGQHARIPPPPPKAIHHEMEIRVPRPHHAPPVPPMPTSMPPPPPPPPRFAPPPPPALPQKRIPLPPPPPPPREASGPPSLPKPSISVQRLQRQKAKKGQGQGHTGKASSSSNIDIDMADIWASNDELKFEGDLEGTTASENQHQQNGTNGNGNGTFRHHKHKKRKGAQEEERYDPLCPNDEGYGEYRSKDQIQRSTMQQKRKRQRNGNNDDDHDGDKDKDGNKDGVDGGDKYGDGGHRKSKAKACSWHYIDQAGVLQGPFSSEQMIGWSQAGFFPGDTMVRNGQQGEFSEMNLVDLSTGRMNEESVSNHEDVNVDVDVEREGIDDQPVESVEDRIAALKRSIQESPLNRVEDRIAALKNGMNDQPVESVEDRIAALKRGMQESPLNSVEDKIAALKNGMNDQPVESVEDRIAALKRGMQESPMESVEDRIAALKNNVIEEPMESVEDRIAALKGKAVSLQGEDINNATTYVRLDPPNRNENDKGIEVPSHNLSGNDNQVPEYPVGDEEGNNDALAYPAVTTYPIDDGNEPIAYYVGNEGDSAAPYPEVDAYPSDEGNNVAAYPVMDEAEQAMYPTDVAYPAVDDDNAYPNTDDAYMSNTEGGEVAPYYIPPADKDDDNAPPKKAVFKGDKAVVGFVPSNLKVRRTMKTKKPRKRAVAKAKIIATEETKNVTLGTEPVAKAVTDDYEKFMTEINLIK